MRHFVPAPGSCRHLLAAAAGLFLQIRPRRPVLLRLDVNQKPCEKYMVSSKSYRG